MIRHNPNNDHASKNELARSYYKTSEDIITIRYHLLNIIFLRVSILIIVTSPILIQHNPYKNQASFAQVIDPIYSHASYFGKSIGLNKRTVPINRTVSSKWHQRVPDRKARFARVRAAREWSPVYQGSCIDPPHQFHPLVPS